MKKNIAYIQRKNEDAILDLLMLALSKRFHLIPLDKTEAPIGIGVMQPEYSGFTILAANLSNWKIIINSLVIRDDLTFGLQ